MGTYTLRLVVTSIRNSDEGGARPLNSIMYSKRGVRGERRKRLIDLNNQGYNFILPETSWPCYQMDNSQMPNYRRGAKASPPVIGVINETEHFLV